jgi:small subunit ribosomal protein S6
MAYYESVFIARQDVTPAQVEQIAAQAASIVAAQGGKVTKTESWGLRNLAYRINKNRKGHYVLMNLDAPAAAVLEMERNLKINEDVLRYMTVRVEELEAGPSAVMRKSDDRFERDDRGFGGDRGGRGGDRGYRPRPARTETESEGEE